MKFGLRALVALTAGLTLPAQSFAAGYSYSAPVMTGFNSAAVPSHWTTGYAVMAHVGSVNDGLVIPLTVHSSGYYVPAHNTGATLYGVINNNGAYLNGQMACLQLSGVDSTFGAITGGTTKCNIYYGSNLLVIQQFPISVPQDGFAYAYVTGNYTVKLTTIEWSTDVN